MESNWVELIIDDVILLNLLILTRKNVFCSEIFTTHADSIVAVTQWSDKFGLFGVSSFQINKIEISAAEIEIEIETGKRCHWATKNLMHSKKEKNNFYDDFDKTIPKI